jgi:hypothetical protein
MGTWSTAYPVNVALKPGKSIKAGGKKYTAVDCATDHALRNFVSESDFFHRGTFTGPYTGRPGDVTLTYGAYEPEALRIDGKPNPLIMRHAMETLGCSIDETVIVGDRMDTDIVAGIQTQIDTYREENIRRTGDIIAGQVAAYISDMGREAGLTCHPVVTTRLEDGVPFPDTVTMDIPRNEDLAARIAAELGIPRERQIWQER